MQKKFMVQKNPVTFVIVPKVDKSKIDVLYKDEIKN